ncbi:MAG: hypothetical protein CL677_01875 [Bdellovibrionaceae bacterium]|nr:hypothetical protein [Pseudobdellovibrionaceae bacterium]|tara:strand:- start:111920 stop:112588 length:669 start_codon:yes stop_codon:yes gene_type:complete
MSIKDYFDRETNRDTLIHKFLPSSPHRLIPDGVLERGPLNEMIPLASMGPDARIILISKLQPQLYVATIGLGIVEARLFTRGTFEPAVLDRKTEILPQLIQQLRSYPKFSPKSKYFRVAGYDGRLSHSQVEIWVGEHNAGLTPHQLVLATESHSSYPGHIRYEEYHHATKLLSDFRRALQKFFIKNQKSRLLLDELGYSSKTLPDEAFIYHNGRWHLNLLTL